MIFTLRQSLHHKDQISIVLNASILSGRPTFNTPFFVSFFIVAYQIIIDLSDDDC